MSNRCSILVALAGLSAAAGSAFGDGQVNMTAPGAGYLATYVSGYIGQMGGPGGSATSFTTFCIELDEFFYPGTTYDARLSDEAEQGGVGGPSPDPLSSRTAALYQTFREGGSIDGSVVDTAAEYTALQDAIWASEEEVTYASLSALAKSMYDWAEEATDGDTVSDIAAFSGGSLGKVRVMQLWETGDTAGNVQDMLTLIPLPGTAGLASLGLMGVVLTRRRIL